MMSEKTNYIVKDEHLAITALANAKRIFARYGNVVDGDVIGNTTEGFVVVIRMTYIHTNIANFLAGDKELEITNDVHFPLVVDGVQVAVELISDNSLVPSRQQAFNPITK